MLNEEHGFFADPKNRRFFACEHASRPGDLRAPALGFAIYQHADGNFHPLTLIFILSEPFSSLRNGFGDSARESWWDYQHILRLRDETDVQANCAGMWSRHYDDGAEASVARCSGGAGRLAPQEFLSW